MIADNKSFTLGKISAMMKFRDHDSFVMSRGLEGDFGDDVVSYLSKLCDDVVIEYGFHPDDDHEKIIERVELQLEEYDRIKRLPRE